MIYGRYWNRTLSYSRRSWPAVYKRNPFPYDKERFPLQDNVTWLTMAQPLEEGFILNP